MTRSKMSRRSLVKADQTIPSHLSSRTVKQASDRWEDLDRWVALAKVKMTALQNYERDSKNATYQKKLAPL